jgi:multidrug efflux pump subunit AcrB
MEVLTEMKSTLFPELQKRFKGLNFEFDGQMGRVMEAQPSMKLALLLGLLCVFFVLSYQFGSWTEPLLIMSAVPLALIGVVWGHILMGMDLSMPSMVGFISLVGIVVNNSILLVQFIRMRQKEYDNLEQAVTAAVKERFRPIMITTLTTLAGMLPLLTERSMQAQILIPLVISVVFGLAVATVLVLLAVPCIYLLSGMHGASEEM